MGGEYIWSFFFSLLQMALIFFKNLNDEQTVNSQYIS